MLALVGSGEYLPAMEPVDLYLISKLRKPPRVACLPTAAGKEGPERIAYWSRLGVDHYTRLGVCVESLPVIDRASANDKGLADAIAAANLVYLSGGKPDYLYRTLEGSLAWEAILSVLARWRAARWLQRRSHDPGPKVLRVSGLEARLQFSARSYGATPL